ncbi:MAG TPA: type IV pilin protein [Gammaproteobacteria bacterium]|nr:type IV pilin protein [Gammaproteobacteria bacterium]
MNRNNGFTLLELLIVVALIGILAAVGYPSYQSSMLKGHRAEAQADMLEAAGFIERIYTENGNYTAAVLPFSVSPRTGTTSYALTLANNATSFTITATPSGAQSNDPCGTLAVDSTGAQTAAIAGCW